MPADIDDLTTRIEQKLADANDRLRQQQRQAEEEARQQQARHATFLKLAADMLRDEIIPRLQKLVGYFPNASVSVIDTPGTYAANCTFRHSPRFPATVQLTVGCAHDDRVEQFLCYYDLEILPVYIEFPKHDQKSSPLEPLDRAALLAWFDDKIVQFLDTYLRLEFVDQYQRENWVTDPVGQMRLNLGSAAAQSTYKGKTYYFRTDENRQQFEAAPEKYVGP